MKEQEYKKVQELEREVKKLKKKSKIQKWINLFLILKD
jgi:hypothetical protein